MLKTIIVASAVSAMFLSAGRTTYSALQFQSPVGSAFKMTPDPSNIWRFHESYRVTRTGPQSITVLVDFDGDGKMDTNYSTARVLITDISIRTDHGAVNFTLTDDQGPIWVVPLQRSTSTTGGPHFLGDHMRTPLVLPVNSGLKVEFQAFKTGGRVEIHLTGRLVTL